VYEVDEYTTIRHLTKQFKVTLDARRHGHLAERVSESLKFALPHDKSTFSR
jgi:hypothetical protein